MRQTEPEFDCSDDVITGSDADDVAMIESMENFEVDEVEPVIDMVDRGRSARSCPPLAPSNYLGSILRSQ